MTRFQYAVFASLLVHAFVIFGLGIHPPDLSKLDTVAPQLEVVLVNAKSASRPLTADALAQQNLEGGGNVDDDRRAKSPLPVINESRTTQLEMQARHVEQLEQESRRLMAQVKSRTTVIPTDSHPQPEVETKAAPDAAQLLNSGLEIARLEAQIDKDWDAYQKRPRRRFVGARTQEYRFARYIEDWRLKIERIGTLNYPDEAREQKIYGSLQLTVSIRADGSVEKIEINRSSGQPVLDEAAKRIVRLGEPYAPFPPDIAKDVDILSITRTWSFTRSDQFMFGE